ncbi:MAG TPA: 2-phosphosulfolactate phosphatase [Acidimicrobiales bacterium]
MPSDPAPTVARFLPRWEVGDITGAVVVIDVIRAFSTAAYALAAGATEIILVAEADEALAVKDAHPGSMAMGEVKGHRPDGFDLPNSPVMASQADVDGRLLVQRTSAGTQGVVAARSATRLWCAGLVNASATAAAVQAAGLGAPTYVITGHFQDRPDRLGPDDRMTAELIERARLGQPLRADETAAAIAGTDEATRTLALGADHVHPDDIAYACRVDTFDFAMEVTRRPTGLHLNRRPAP